MPTISIRAMQVPLGNFTFISLDRLARPARKEEINFADCGVCEHEHHYWVGERAQAGGKDVLRVSVLDAFEKRDEEYPSWGEEELCIVFGRNGMTGEFQWFLLTKEELKNKGMRS